DDVEFSDFASPFELNGGIGLRLHRFDELLLAEFLARDEKDNVVGHQFEDLVDISRLGGRHPGVDKLADLVFVSWHENLAYFMVRTTRKRALPLAIWSYASATFSSG